VYRLYVYTIVSKEHSDNFVYCALKQVLRFADNELTFLGIDTFHSYQALQHIYLGRNRIQTVAPDAFRALRNLQILDLEANRLRTVPTSAFGHVSSVRILSLKSNPITYIAADAFRPLVNLEELNLENCWLNRIQPGAFAGLTLLGELNLVNNELAGLPADMRSDLPPTLTVLRLHRNPWRCDCRLRWLRRFVDGGRSSTSINWDFAARNTPVCSDPELLRGVSWRHLAANQFACPPTQIVGNGTTSVELHVGSDASITCVVGGDPSPIVTWMKGTSYVAAELVVQRTEDATTDDDPSRLHSVLQLTSVTPQDAGDYKCVAANPAGRSEVTYKVWVIDGLRDGDGQERPRDGRGTDAAAAGDRVGVSTEAMFGVAVGITILFATLCAYATFIVARRRRVLQNCARGRKEQSATNSYVMAAVGNTPTSRKSTDENEIVETNNTRNCRPNHNDVRHAFPNAVSAVDDGASRTELVHVAPFQFAAADDTNKPSSEFAMKIFAANRARDADDDSPSQPADATPSPPPRDCVELSTNHAVVELPMDTSSEPGSSSRREDDDHDNKPIISDEQSHTDAISEELRHHDHPDDISTTTSISPLPSLSASHASHCANPVCLRERLLDRPASSLPPVDMCSHRLALSSRTSSPDHGRVRVAILQRPRGSPGVVHDVDVAGSLPYRPLLSGARTSNSRHLFSRPVDVGCYSTLPAPRRMTYSDDHGPRLRARRGQYATLDDVLYGHTLPRQHHRMPTAHSGLPQRESVSISSTRQLSGSSSAIDIRDLEIAATTSPCRAPHAKSPTVATSLHDILSPPFGPPKANGPKATTGKALTLKPGHQDEFGTAV